MALKKINFLQMFYFINLLSVSLSESIGLTRDSSSIDESTGTIYSTYQPHSFNSFPFGTDSLNTSPFSNASCRDGKCELHDYMTGWYESAIIIFFGMVLIISNVGFILRHTWLKRYKHDSVKGKRDNSSGLHKKKSEPILSSIANQITIFTVADIKVATFGSPEDTCIAEGDCNKVYKGCLPDGREVAIKCSTKKGNKHELAFQIELSVLTEVRHENLTSLIGYCTEDNEGMLIFEYMNNGTLYDQLYHTNFQPDSPFNTWKVRIKILFDCARGIECLHKHANRGIIHRDISASNILLDENWNARISDLGLALVGPQLGTERVDVDECVGTFGYRDPDCNSATHSVTLKYDVYSFGVVMIEMLTADGVYNEHSDMIFADFIAPKIIAGKLPAYLDKRPNLPAGVDARAVRLIGNLSERCIRRTSILRPTMSEVVQEIENVIALYD